MSEEDKDKYKEKPIEYLMEKVGTDQASGCSPGIKGRPGFVHKLLSITPTPELTGVHQRGKYVT